MRNIQLAFWVALSLVASVKAADVILQSPIVQGNASQIAYDSSGNKFVAGNFQGSLDFNPFTGQDIVTSSGGGQSGFITKFNSDGTYGWTKTTGVGELRGLVISGTSVFACGYFTGTAVSVGGVGTVTSAGLTDVYILALKTSDGSPVTTFNTTGVVLFGGSGVDGMLGNNNITVSSGVLYVAGAFAGTASFPGNVAPITSAGLDDGFVIAIDTTTGLPVASFNGGSVKLGGALTDDARSLYVSGGRVYVAGRISVGASNGNAYVASIIASTGALDTAFNTTGYVTFGGTDNDVGIAVTVLGTSVYLVGEYHGSSVGVGGSGTLVGTNVADGIFVLALNSTTGSVQSAFNGVASGVASLNSGMQLNVTGALGVGNTLFVCGSALGANVGINGTGAVNIQGAGADALLAAFDATTGKALTSFSGDGIYTIGGAFAENGYALALKADNVTLTFVGNTTGTDIGIASPPNIDPNGFVLDIPVATGAVDWVVSTTSGSGSGSLPAALLLARYGSKITFDAATFDLRNSDAATVISLSAGLNLFDDNISIDASDRRVTLNGSAATSQSGLTIRTSGNRIVGLTILAFPRNGVRLESGAKNNIIGGNRGSGKGPNGLGLRISSNGISGISITGSSTKNNTVQGCWIGLDASGTESKPNLAGILIESGANANIIGGVNAGEENVISGNEFEGITVSGASSDKNVILGNRVGIAGILTTATTTATGVLSRASDDDGGLSRTSIGNGSAGVFLSLGTNASKVGGTGTGESNTIANNGGNGIEIRAVESRLNSVRANRITRNVKGGISLFDGANDGVAAPTISAVKKSTTKTASATARIGSRSLGRTTVAGTAAAGEVEIYNDSGSQGSTLVGSTTASGGTYSVEVDTDDSMNVTATLTDANGNTSSFAIFTSADTLDTDSDGVTDVLESIAGTDSTSASSTPTAQGTVSISKGTVTANFVKTGKDSIVCTLSLVLPDGFSLANSSVGVYFAGIGTTVTLDSKGKATKGTAKLTLQQGKESTTLRFNVRNQDLRTALDAAGFSNTTTEAEGSSVDVTLGVGLNNGTTGYVYSGTATLTYKATLDKNGKGILLK